MLSFLTSFAIMRSAMNMPTHFLYYDTFEENWLKATMEELTSRDDPDLYIIPVYKNGSEGQQCQWSDFLIKQKEVLKEIEANKPARYEYEVIEYTKYKKLLPEYDTTGLKEKINNLAQNGYRLVGISSFTDPIINVQGIIAVMERPRK